MSDSPTHSVAEVLPALTKDQILRILTAHGVYIPNFNNKTKAQILDIIESVPAGCRVALVEEAEAKLIAQQLARSNAQKRKVEVKAASWLFKRPKTQLSHDTEQDPFLVIPADEIVRRCHKAFLNATSNSALKSEVCVCCARQLFANLGRAMALETIPNSHHLKPSTSHFAHILTSELLLETRFIYTIEGKQYGWFCDACTRALVQNRLPPLALANRMWIGPVPDQLSELTVPERSLISLYHPRVYVYKLHPRNFWTDAHLQTGLAGNVTTYALNLPDVVKMVSGKLLPRPLAILSATIVITMIGPATIPPTWLLKTFQVRRAAVYAALLCLKFTTRHPAYSDIEISQTELDTLPAIGEVPLDILATMRNDPDPNIAQREAESYLNNENACQPLSSIVNNSDPGSTPAQSNQREAESAPDVIPLQYLAAVDMDLSSVPPEEMMQYGLAKINPGSNTEGVYAVRHGRVPINEFGYRQTRSSSGTTQQPQDPAANLSVNTLPWLFPYGEGGIEAERPVYVPMAEHVRCNIQEWSGRFSRDHTYPFLFFSILQKRQAMFATSLTTKRANFDGASSLFSTLTLADLSRASEESAKGQPPSNPTVALLRRMVHSAGGKVMGSDAMRATYRSQIASTSLSLNPPSLWMTINPTDLHDPIVQVFAGESIDMDRFNSTLGPDAQRRAENLAANPYAAAKFFNFMIRTMFETLFGIRIVDNRVVSTLGVLGYVSGYYGVVEAQGRGSLHLHALLWLANTPSSDDLQQLLQSEEFRQRLAQYIDSTIHAHLDELTAESLRSRPHEPELAWSRPPDPSSPDYANHFKEMEARLARSQQLHECRRNTCLTIFEPKTRTWTCKRKAPFPLSETTTVSLHGTINPKRTQGNLNGWNPSVLVYGRCNNDLKFFTNGSEARRARWYITGYATKGQHRTNNLSALLAKRLVHHFDEDDKIRSMRDRSGLLIFRALHAINRQQEQSGQQVFNLLMGYGDNPRSHLYAPLYLSAVISELCRAFKDVQKYSTTQHIPNSEAGQTHIQPAGSTEPTEDTVTIDIDSSGHLMYRSQLQDYSLRGPELADQSFFRFIADTYESPVTLRDSMESEDHATASGKSRRGRPRHERSRYLPEHPKSAAQLRVIRPPDHNTLTNIVGPWIPRNDRPKSHNLYCATVLALLKPWRRLTDLRVEHQLWPAAFDVFMQTTSKREHNFVSAAQYYYQCEDAADREDVGQKTSVPEGSGPWEVEDEDEELDDYYDPVDDPAFCPTEEQIVAFQRSCIRWNDLQYAEHAIALGRASGVLPKSELVTWLVNSPPLAFATEADNTRFSRWRNIMAADARSRRERLPCEATGRIPDLGSIEVTTGFNERHQNSFGSITHAPDVEEWIEPLDVVRLKPDQRRAYDMVATHLDDNLAHRNPKQLLMLIQGEGGTGKSMVMSCLTELFAQRKVAGMLLKGAPTGIAASVINGSTLHTLCHLSVNDKQKFGDKTLQALRETWKGVEYFIIDEISMVSRTFLSRISVALAAAKNIEDYESTSLAFGGLNMVVCGDFGQFEPVARGPRAPLYQVIEPGDTREEKHGRVLYEALATVVLLKEQCRTRDAVWLQILRNVRRGACTPEDIREMRNLIVRFGGSDDGLDLGEDWQDAVLVTPRNITRIDWNTAANRMHAMRKGVQLLICPAEDTIGGRPITGRERWDAVQSKG